MTRFLPLLLLAGCCGPNCTPEPQTCTPSGDIELTPSGAIVTITGPATLIAPEGTLTVPAGEIWRWEVDGWCVQE